MNYYTYIDSKESLERLMGLLKQHTSLVLPEAKEKGYLHLDGSDNSLIYLDAYGFASYVKITNLEFLQMAKKIAPISDRIDIWEGGWITPNPTPVTIEKRCCSDFCKAWRSREEPPKESGYVLVVNKGHLPFIVMYHKEEESFSSQNEITHWMPLPKVL